MPAAVIAGGIAAAGAVGGAAIGASASNKASRRAAQAQQDATASNNALQRETYAKNEGYLSPSIETGQTASNALMQLFGLAPTDPSTISAFDKFRGSTGYQFRMNEGLGSLASNFRARGLSQSGAAIKANQRFGQNIASDEFGRYVSYLGNQQGVGLTAASALAGVGQNYANSVSANNQNSADAIGNAALISAQNKSAVFGTAANALGQFGSTLASSYSRSGTPYYPSGPKLLDGYKGY